MTDIRSLIPNDRTALRRFLPDPPADTTVAKARATIAVIDATTTSVRAELDEAEERERSTAVELVAAATEGHGLTPILTAWRPGRAHAEQRLALLARARSIAMTQHDRAQRSDPAYLQWQADCKRISFEWQEAQASETPEQRFEQMLNFVETYGQKPR